MVPAWWQTVILVPARTFALKFDDIYPPRSMDSKQLCTRAEVDGGANKGLPQTPPPLTPLGLRAEKIHLKIGRSCVFFTEQPGLFEEGDDKHRSPTCYAGVVRRPRERTSSGCILARFHVALPTRPWHGQLRDRTERLRG